SIVWGFVFGEFLGNVFERWPAAKPLFYIPAHGDNGIIPTLLYRVEEFQPLLVLCLGFGLLQVVGGWIIRAIKAAQHGDRKQLFEGIGMASGLLALVIFAWAFMSNMLTTPVLIICGIGLLVFLACVVLSGMALMLVELISNSGHILSYLRLFAVGLSAALVANLSTDLGFAVSGVIPVPVLGPLLGIAVALTIHLTAIVLTIIGHTLQPLRLQYVEFFTKFGFYENTGRPYKPFRLTGGKA
ncbi:MAG TPA: V-type ATP synthase subunit I, partial [Deinococcales bacterium]|nr:V-type ATP synthase subunit I [Deinococcales bacterium]